MTGDAFVPGTPRLVARMGCCVPHTLLVAGQAGVVGVLLFSKPVAAARGVTFHAMQFPRLHARTHHP